MIHQLKILPPYFNAQVEGLKNFEFRKNDRNYKVGDLLALNEVTKDAKQYTGNSLLVEVTYILDVEAHILNGEGYVVLGTRKLWVKFKDGDRCLINGKPRDVFNTTTEGK